MNQKKSSVIEYINKGSVPLDIMGTIDLPRLAEREIVQDYLKHHKVNDTVLLNHFHKMLSEFLQKLCAQDHEGLSTLVEKRFHDKLKSFSETLKSFPLEY